MKVERFKGFSGSIVGLGLVVAFAVGLGGSADTALAGGGGSKSKVNVRTENFTEATVTVGVANRNPQATRELSPGDIAQFKINKGAFAVNQDGDVFTGFNTGSKKTVYIALTDAGPEPTSTRF